MLTFSFTGVVAGVYDIGIGYYAWGPQLNYVKVNSGNAVDKSWPQTYPNGWSTMTISGVSLQAGTNTIQVYKDYGYIYVDYATITTSSPNPAPTGSSITIQAEAGTYTGSLTTTDTSIAGYQGSGYVGDFHQNGDALTITFTNVVAGYYQMAIRYFAWGPQMNYIKINNEASIDYSWPATYPNGWGTLTNNSVELVAGTNSITISKDYGYIYVDSVTITPLASTPGSPSSGGPSTVQTVITVADHPNTYLQGPTYVDGKAAWLGDGVWGSSGLGRGIYTGPTGTQYEQYIGIAPTLGSNGELVGRLTWGWPQADTSRSDYSEIKTYPSILYGKKPGIQNSWITPGGYSVILPDGTQSQIYPSGPTPGTTFPYKIDSTLPDLLSSFDYKHNMIPTGRGHLSYDLWLQNTSVQQHGFNSANELTHEIMIPVSYWGNYGSYGTRNPAWYDHDVTIDGILWHVYASKNSDGTFTAPSAYFQWKFIVFEPDGPSVTPKTINLKNFINHLKTLTDSAGTPWLNGNEWFVSQELGIEIEVGEGDCTWSNRVWQP
jgi:hypothetical protein